MMTVNLAPAALGEWIKLLCPLAVPGKFSLGLLAPLVCMALAFWNKADKKGRKFPQFRGTGRRTLSRECPGTRTPPGFGPEPY